MIEYEFPLGERIRTLLRLEDLFGQMRYFLRQGDVEAHHVALLKIFEVLEVAGRADLKLDLIQELERQRQSLLVYRNNPDISEDALSGALYEIEQASAALLGMTGKVGHYLRENEWLNGIRNRASIPGGVCQFDLPFYHYWRHHDAERRRHDIESWIRPLMPIRAGVEIVLRLLRSSGQAESQTAVRGNYQLMLGGRAAPQLVRLAVAPGESAIPEVSANKFALNVRFVCPEGDHKPKACDRDVNFQMTFCNI